MREIIRCYRLFNVLSLDVAAGAIVNSLFFARIYQVKPSIPSLISLGLTVWIIYTVDRLMDVRDVIGEAASARHRFHQRNQNRLLYFLAGVMIVDALLIFFMPLTILKHGLLLTLVVVMYLILRSRLHISKELFVAALYTVGIMLPVFPLTQPGNERPVLIFLFFLIALINLILFSRQEMENDQKDKQHSVATLLNERIVRQILTALFITTISINSYLFFILEFEFIALIFLAMILAHLILFLLERNFAKNDNYRLIGDAIFLFPIIYVIV